jgi:hypothetical protein
LLSGRGEAKGENRKQKAESRNAEKEDQRTRDQGAKGESRKQKAENRNAESGA